MKRKWIDKIDLQSECWNKLVYRENHLHSELILWKAAFNKFHLGSRELSQHVNRRRSTRGGRASGRKKKQFLGALMSSKMNFSRGYGSWPTLHVPRVYTCSVTSRVHTRGRASTCTNTTVCIAVQDLPRHRHSDPRLSVSFQSQTRWMAGEWKSWLKPNPTPLHPSIGWKGRRRKRENARGRAPHHSVWDHPYTERATTLALFRASISYHPLSRLLCFKIQIRRRKEIARNLLFSLFDLISVGSRTFFMATFLSF